MVQPSGVDTPRNTYAPNTCGTVTEQFHYLPSDANARSGGFAFANVRNLPVALFSHTIDKETLDGAVVAKHIRSDRPRLDPLLHNPASSDDSSWHGRGGRLSRLRLSLHRIP